MKKNIAVSYPSAYTILSGDSTLEVKRDTDGEYLIVDQNSETAIYLGNAQCARRLQVVLEELLDANEEV